MKTFLAIEVFVMYQLLVIGVVVMIGKDLISSYKKYKKEKAEKNCDSLGKL